jgi:hypothetical protein
MDTSTGYNIPILEYILAAILLYKLWKERVNMEIHPFPINDHILHPSEMPGPRNTAI